jgi:hypothetical protein
MLPSTLNDINKIIGVQISQLAIGAVNDKAGRRGRWQARSQCNARDENNNTIKEGGGQEYDGKVREARTMAGEIMLAWTRHEWWQCREGVGVAGWQCGQGRRRHERSGWGWYNSEVKKMRMMTWTGWMIVRLGGTNDSGWGWGWRVRDMNDVASKEDTVVKTTTRTTRL